ncbi:hypothetical protein [Granulicella mallensis]|uniref:Uncharacterized protein n=1 Tax=Granulicella mallensis TaxID=940614 RepID=A0A7W7ZQ36_9BACT|nr:hypothetical protein [Granulicella mallensis]MBB5064012.1 hypothetical protein [Granulicella mallensis]
MPLSDYVSKGIGRKLDESGFQPSGFYWPFTWGFAPGWDETRLWRWFCGASGLVAP